MNVLQIVRDAQVHSIHNVCLVMMDTICKQRQQNLVSLAALRARHVEPKNSADHATPAITSCQVAKAVLSAKKDASRAQD